MSDGGLFRIDVTGEDTCLEVMVSARYDLTNDLSACARSLLDSRGAKGSMVMCPPMIRHA